MTLSEAFKLFGTLVLIANMALNVYLFRRTVTGAELKAMREAQRKGDELRSLRVERIDANYTDIALRLAKLETRVDALPTHDDISDIRGTLTEMTGELAANTERTNATLEAVRDIRNYLLDKTR